MTDQAISPTAVQNETAASIYKKAIKEGKFQEVFDNSTELYRHYDFSGRLLYIGVSLSSLGRLAGHRESSSWFKLIKAITIERYPNRALALEAEREAIKKEKPYFNRTHRRGWRNVKLTSSGHSGMTAGDLAFLLKKIAQKQEPKV